MFLDKVNNLEKKRKNEERKSQKYESQKSGLIFITTAKKRQIKMKIYEYFLTGCLI